MHIPLPARLLAAVLLILWAGTLTAQTAGRAASDSASQAKAGEAKPKAADAKAKGTDSDKAAANKVKKTKKAKSQDKAKEGKERKAPKEAVAEKGTAATIKKAKVVRFVLRGSYPESLGPAGLFAEQHQSLSTVIRRMDRTAQDASVAAVLLHIEDLQIGSGKVCELRAAIGRLRKAGKPVYAEISGADRGEYLVASACDEVALAPSGGLLIPGVRAEVTFYKGLLDKVGVQFDLLQMGKYKGAGEPLTRTSLSPALRESLEKLVDDSYEDMIGLIAKDRKLEPAKVKELVDRGIFTAETACKARLVDRLAYPDQVLEAIRTKLKAEDVQVVAAQERKAADMDFSGFSGFMKFMELAMGGKPSERVSRDKKIAVVYAVGPIVSSASSGGIFTDEVVSANVTVKALRQAADDPKCSAIVLRIDSPGGSAVASDLIWREVVRMNKPVIASMGDVAGSGGYYIAMGARKIVAAPGTITGSIGVIGGKLVLGGLMEKIGVNTEVISRGKNSGAMSPTRPFTPEERRAWISMMEETYQQFVSKAAKGRKMPVKKLEELAQGRVYTGRMAAANGLVDALGTLDDAIAEAKKAAGIQADEKVEIWNLPKRKTIFEQLFADPSDVSSDVRLDLAIPGVGDALLKADLLRRLFAEPAVMLMPFELKVK